MAIKTKYTFPNASGANGQSTTVFANHGIELNNQDDLDVYVYLSTTGRVLQHRQATGSTTDANHEQVNDTTGLYFPSVATGVTLYNYTLSTDFNTITFNSAIPTGGIVSVERRTRDSSSNYTNFTSGGSIRSTELNSAFDESNFTAQEARNKAFDLENKLLYSNYTPYKDDTIDLGSSAYQWKNLYIDGTAYLDAVDIDAGNIDGTTIGGYTPAAGTFTTLTTSSNATVNGNIVVTGTISDSGGNLELSDDVNISGHIRLPDDKKLYLGNGDDAYIDWDTDGWFDRVNIRSNGDIWSYVPSGKSHLFSVNNAGVLGVNETYIEAKKDLKPGTNNSFDLGKSDKQWKDLYVDGTGYIDTVSAENLTVSGTTTLAAGSIGTSEIADNAIDSNKLAPNSVNTTEIVGSAVTTGALANNAVITAKIADNAITHDQIATNSIDTDHIKDGNITNILIADNAINGNKIVADAITTAKIADDAVTVDKLANDSVGADQILANGVGTIEIVDNAITTPKIADAELRTLAGMQSGTASILASGTTLTATIAEINTVVDGKSAETIISNTDHAYPTSGAVIDYVTAQIAPLGGLEVISNEDNFPATQPASGVVISIADAGGIVVNGSGVSTTARTAGNGSDNVTINGFPSTLHNETLVDNMGLLVSSTGSSNTYTYHKLLGKEDDIKQLSSDINDFKARYRVGSSNPSSDNDAGDLFFNTATDKLLVRNAANNSWDEAQSVGNFYISTLTPTSGSGNPFDGSQTEFTITNAPTYASQVLLIINGVLQKPNAGTSAPADGFALDGSTVKLGGAPATGSTYSAVVIGSTVNIGTPSDNTVSTAIIQNLAVTGDKIATNLDLADNKKIRFGTGNDTEIYFDGTDQYFTSAGKFRFKHGSDTAIKTLVDGAVYLYYDNSPKLYTTSSGIFVGGHIDLDDSSEIQIGTGDDLKIYHDGSHNYITNAAGKVLYFYGDDFSFKNAAADETLLSFSNGYGVNLYYDNSKKLETTSTGVKYTGDLRADDDYRIKLGTSQELNIYHHNSGVSVIENTDQVLKLRAKAGEEGVLINPDGSCDLYHNGFKSFNTTDTGIHIWGPEGTDASIYMYADDGDDNPDKWKQVVSEDASRFRIMNYNSGSWETNIECNGDNNAELYYDGSKKFETSSTGATITGSLVPDANNSGALGSGSLAWSAAYITALRIHTDGQWYDNAKATFGHGEDLQIFHDGTDTQLSAGSDGRSGYVTYIVNDGNNADRYGIRIQCGADDASGTNYGITLADGNNTYQGAITFSGGTITYGTFTAYHPCIVPDSENPSDSSNAYPYGTLLETISIEYTQKNGANTERGIRYKVQKTQSANSRKVLGAYGSSMNGGPDGQTNEHQALVLGDGHILVNNAGGNIEVGDGICSSATAGIGQKATANPSMIIGIAQEAVTFTGSETKLVAVQYGLQQFIPWT